MTSELRPEFDIAAYISTACGAKHVTPRAIAVIEADRVAVRAEQAAELAKFKALPETLAGALELYAQWGVVGPHYDDGVHEDSGDTAREALRQYKEARDAS